MSGPRLLALMGSGETAPPMAKVHRRLTAMIERRPPNATLIATPYAFQENAAEITARTLEYFATNVGLPLSAVDLGGSDAEPVEEARALASLAEADLVFAGPGSPSYALDRWRPAGLASVLATHLQRSGIVTFASAAALTLGSHTIPVYEIYKVGADPYWLDGLDVLGALGLRVAVVPHYDNAEGGTHDTRFCYLGERRLARLERELPDDVFVLGIDSHTALLLDFDSRTASVEGLGGATVRAAGRSRVVEAGEAIAIDDLASMAADLRSASATGIRPSDGAVGLGRGTGPLDPSSSPTPLEEDVRQAEARVEEALGAGSTETVLASLIDMDETLVAWSADTDRSGELERARHAFHALIARALSAGDGQSAPGLTDELVELLVDLRDRARDGRDYERSDRIRDALASAGIELRDGPDGSSWVPLDRRDRATS
jgi:hypothetical protein